MTSPDRPRLIYGGGVKIAEQVESLVGGVDIIDMGTVFEEDPLFVERTRKILDALLEELYQ